MKLKDAIAMLLVLGGLLISSPTTAANEVDFVKDIKPILEKHCLHCHGQEAPEAFTMEPDEVFDYIVAGAAEESMLYRVLVSGDEEELMPPPDFKQPLRKEQIQLIKKWINQGADWPAGVELQNKSLDEQSVSVFGFAVLQDNSLSRDPGLRAGVTVFARLKSTRRKILEIHRKTYSELKLTDSTGKELKIKQRDLMQGIEKSLKQYGGTRDVLLTLSSPIAPDVKTESVRVSGVVTAICYDDTVTQSVDKKVDSNEFSVAQSKYVIEKVTPYRERGHRGKVFEIRSEQSPMKSLRVVGKDGVKKRPKLIRQRTDYDSGGKRSHLQYFLIYDEAFEITKLEVTYYRGITIKEVPVDIGVNLGSIEVEK